MYKSISNKVKLSIVTGLSALVLSGCSAGKEDKIYAFRYHSEPGAVIRRETRTDFDYYIKIDEGNEICYGKIVTDDNKIITVDRNSYKIIRAK